MAPSSASPRRRSSSTETSSWWGASCSAWSWPPDPERNCAWDRAALASGGRTRPTLPAQPRPAARTPERAGSAVGLLLLLLLFLAADAEGGDRSGLQPLGADRLLAPLAHTEGAVVDAEQCPLDLLQQEFLAVPEAEHHRLGVLAGGEVDLVGKVVGIEVRLLHQRLLGTLEEGGLAVLEHLPVTLEIFLIQGVDSPLHCPPGTPDASICPGPQKKRPRSLICQPGEVKVT